MESVSVVTGGLAGGPASLASLTAWWLPCGLFICLGLASFMAAAPEPAGAARRRNARAVLLLSAACAALMFAWMLRDMLCLVRQDCAPWLGWEGMDEPILTLLFAALAQRHTDIWIPVTGLGSTPWLVAVGVLASSGALWRRDWWRLLAWALAGPGIALWIWALKLWVRRPRPELALIGEQGWSFPSGHSAGSLVVYGLLAWTAAGSLRARGRGLAALLAWCAALALVALVGISRVVLSVHHASDVMAAWLLGIAWLGLLLALLDWLRERRGLQ